MNPHTDLPVHNNESESPMSTLQHTSTLAMTLENPSSASLALTIGSIHYIDTTHQNHTEDIELKGGKESATPQQTSDIENAETVCSKEISSTEPNPLEGKLLDYPEGGFGWLVVLASFIVNFWAFAPNMTFGVYQAYYLKENTFPGALATEISWVGSIGTAAMFIPGPFVAPMTRFIGLRAVVLVGIVIATAGLISASFCTQLWQLYITEGFLFGFGGGLVFFSSISVTAQYFEKRRGLANGIAVAGSGIGGLAVAPLTRFLIAKVGHQWCLRIIGFAVFGCMLAIFPFIRPRIKTAKKGPIFDFSLFKVKGFTVLVITAFIVTFGYMVPIFLIPTYTVQVIGDTATTGANLISMFSGINAVSRVILGVAADRLGRTNTLSFCCIFAGVACLAIWSVATNIATLTAFMAVYGLFGGGFISIFPVVAAQVVGIERLSAALGLIYFGNVFGNLLGSPIATAIVQRSNGKYLGAVMFSGFMPVIGGLIILFTIRRSLDKRIFAIA
ncbi:hypothetical protein BGZ76_010242 [Entomortierella beljakovae]|nr:hypothetical protein BGZ76_010242 [Entomortierella beljakovae]